MSKCSDALQARPWEGSRTEKMRKCVRESFGRKRRLSKAILYFISKQLTDRFFKTIPTSSTLRLT